MTRVDPWLRVLLRYEDRCRQSCRAALMSVQGLSELPSFSTGKSISALAGGGVPPWVLSAPTMLGFAVTTPATSATAEKEVRRRCAVLFMTLRAMTEGWSTHTRCHVSDGFSAFAVEFRRRAAHADGEGGAAVRHRSHRSQRCIDFEGRLPLARHMRQWCVR